MIVVSDTSPVSNLLQVQHEKILQELFGEVVIPPAVRDELIRYHSVLPDFLRVASPTSVQNPSVETSQLDPGETEAIALAMELDADFLLIDEKLGRTAAKDRGVRVIGLLGVLLLGKQRGLLVSVGEVLERLTNEAGFFVSAKVKAQVLSLAGEI